LTLPIAWDYSVGHGCNSEGSACHGSQRRTITVRCQDRGSAYQCKDGRATAQVSAMRALSVSQMEHTHGAVSMRRAETYPAYRRYHRAVLNRALSHTPTARREYLGPKPFPDDVRINHKLVSLLGLDTLFENQIQIQKPPTVCQQARHLMFFNSSIQRN